MLEVTYRVKMTLKLTEEGKSNGFGKWLLGTITDELRQSEDVLEWNFTKVEDTSTLDDLRASAESIPDA